MRNKHNQKTVIITGGNSGLGYQCAKAIAVADKDWRVILACRNKDKAAKAVAEMIAETSNQQIETMTLDLASIASVRQFVKDFMLRELPPLRALVCNAGIQIITDTTYTEDGFETTFGVNHLGHFLLVNLLLRNMVAPARIVFVSSGTHDPETFDGRLAPPRYYGAKLLAWPDKMEGSKLSGIQRYTTSKLCNIFCAYELVRRLQSEGQSTPQHSITVNVFDPGGVPSTGLTRDYNSTLRFVLRNILPSLRPLLRLLGTNVNDVSTSGQAMARLVLDPQLEDVSGKYFQGMKEVPSSKESYDQQKAADLWTTSADLVKLSPDESPFCNTTKAREMP